MQQQAPPGWYPDHADAAAVRYWDGHQWTGHQAPAQGSGAHGYAQPHHPGYSTPGPGGYGTAPHQTPPPRQRRTGLIIAVVTIAVVLAVAGFFGVRFFWADDSTTEADAEEATSEDGTVEGSSDADDETDGEEIEGLPPEAIADLTEIPIGDPLQVELPPGETWSGLFSVAEEGIIIFQLWSEFDAVDWAIEVYTVSGSSLATFEGEPGLDFVDGGFVTGIDMEAGDYVVRVSSNDVAETVGFGLSIQPPPRSIQPGDEEAVLIEGYGYIAREVEITESGLYYAQASFTEQYPIMTLVDADGEIIETATSGEPDAVLDVELEPGRYLLMIAKVDNAATDEVIFHVGP